LIKVTKDQVSREASLPHGAFALPQNAGLGCFALWGEDFCGLMYSQLFVFSGVNEIATLSFCYFFI
jgi:hypothetical protein